MKEVETILSYHYTESGLKNLWLESVILVDNDYLETPSRSKLHNSIARVIALKGNLTPDELRFLRMHLDIFENSDCEALLGAPLEWIEKMERGDANIPQPIAAAAKQHILGGRSISSKELEYCRSVLPDAELIFRFQPENQAWGFRYRKTTPETGPLAPAQ